MEVPSLPPQRDLKGAASAGLCALLVMLVTPTALRLLLPSLTPQPQPRRCIHIHSFDFEFVILQS